MANFNALEASALTGVALDQVASVTTPDAMTVVYNLTGPNPTFPSGLTTQVGYVVGEAMIDQATANPNAAPDPDRHRSVHLLAVAAQRPLHRHPQPQLLAQGPPLPGPITFKPIPDTTQRESTLRTGGVDMIESIDPTTITNFSGSGGIGIPAGRQPDRGHRPAHLRLHHAEHGGGPHQRPHHPPGPGQGDEPGRGPEDHRRAAGQAGQRASSCPTRPTTATPTTPPTTRRRPRSWSAQYKAKHGTPDAQPASPSPTPSRSRWSRPSSRCGSRSGST